MSCHTLIRKLQTAATTNEEDYFIFSGFVSYTVLKKHVNYGTIYLLAEFDENKTQGLYKQIERKTIHFRQTL